MYWYMKRIVATICVCLLPFSYVAAEGYQANSQSTKQAGMGHVGTAMKLGAESMHFNPAGLGFLDKQVDISAGVAGVFTKASYKDGNYRHKSDNDPGTPLFVYAGFRINEHLAGGISLTTPYGSTLDWGDNWAGAHLIQNISLKAFSIQPTMAWKITNKLSIGGGLSVMFGNIEMGRSYISSSEIQELSDVLGSVGKDIQYLADKYKLITPISLKLNGDAGLKVGYNLGVMYDVNEKITVGASYRSKVKAVVDEGNISIKYANEAELRALFEELKPMLGDMTPRLDEGYFKSSLPLPSNFTIGVTYNSLDKWLLSFDLQCVGWGAYDKLDIAFTPDELLGMYNQSAPKKYKNTRIYRVGGQYAVTNKLDLRLGVYYDGSPVKTDYLNPETPSMNKLGLTTGFSFRPVDYFSVDFAFGYVTGFGRDGSYTDKSLITQQPREFKGHYTAYALMPSVGFSYYFR